MSQLSNSTTNTNIVSDLSVISADNKTISTGTEQRKKGAASVAPGYHLTKSMTDHHSSKEPVPYVTSKFIDQPKFVSATEIAATAPANVQMMPEISDDELLEMTLMLEKQQEQQNQQQK